MFAIDRANRTHNGSRHSRNSSPAASSPDLDLRRFSYVSFPETSIPPPLRPHHTGQSQLGATKHERAAAVDSLVPKTLLGKFKSVIGASTWISSATTSEHKTSTVVVSSSPSSPSVHAGYHLPPEPENKNIYPYHSRDRLISTLGTPSTQPSSLSNSSTNYPSLQSSVSANSILPREPSPRVGQSYQPTVPGASVAITPPSALVNSIGSPARYASPQPFNQHVSLSNSAQPYRQIPSTVESPRAPFYLHSDSLGDQSQPLKSSDALLRSIVLTHPPGNHELPAVPTFSHIPGFPLARETVADDTNSVLSSSVAPSFTPKTWRIQKDDTEHRAPQRESSGSTSVTGRVQGKGLSKEYWMPDKDAKECYDCGVSFTSWRRKHHCRICGAIFCARCASNLVSGNRFASSGYIRVCNICLDKLDPESDDPSSVTKDDTDTETQSTSEATASFYLSGSRSQLNRASLLPAARSITPTKPRLSTQLSPDPSLSQISHEPQIRNSDDVPSDRELSPQKRPQIGKSFSAQKSLTNAAHTMDPSLSTPLPPSHSTTSSAPFRKGLSDEEQSGILDIKTLKDSKSVLNPSDASKSIIIQATIPSSLQDKRGVELQTSPSKGSHKKLDNLPDMEVDPTQIVSEAEGPHAPADHRTTSIKLTKVNVTLPPPHLAPGLLIENGSTQTSSSSHEHVKMMIRQFLNRVSIDKVEAWEAELTRLLVQLISDPPRPDFDEEDTADIRKLVKIKKIPGGNPNDSEYIHGVGFTKNVVHKKMNTYCINPRVLTISIPLEFQRVDRYSTLEPLIRQERQYLKTLVHRLTSLKPDLLLVEGNVSGVAIEYLVQANVAVIRHVKAGVLQAVARSTQTPVISSLDKLLNLKVGQCELFHVQTLQNKLIPGQQQRKTFVRLEGCEPSLGGTIILRGGPMDLLTKVKALMSMMVRIIYSLRLEQAFCKDECAVMSIHPHREENTGSSDVRKILSRFRRASKLLACPLTPAPPKMGQLNKSETTISQTELPPLSELIEDILKPYTILLLSGSPHVKLSPPFPLTKLRDLNRQLGALRQLIAQPNLPLTTADSLLAESKRTTSLRSGSTVASAPSSSQPIQPENTEESYLTYKPLRPSAKDTVVALTEEHARKEFLRELGRQLEDERAVVNFYLSTHRKETFCAIDHQNIIVQEAVVFTHPTGLGHTCQGPHLREFSFYAPGDQSVGQIIQLIVACHSQVCPAKGCGQLKGLHRTNYIHGHLRASIQIHHSSTPKSTGSTTSSSSTHVPPTVQSEPEKSRDSYEPPAEEGVDHRFIMMQGYCSVCDGHTRKIPMSDDAWRLSFGKFLQLCFYSPGLIPDSLSHSSTGLYLPCNHDSHLEHTRMFFYQGMRIDFLVQKVIVYEAIPPPLTLVTPPTSQSVVRDEEYNTIQKRLESFFNSVKNRIMGFNYDVVASEKQDASEEAMRELLIRVEIDAQTVQAQLDEVYRDCMGTNGVKMNIVRKTLIDKAVEWDQLFSTFELRFIAGENKDARRLTSVQLRKLFSDQTSTPGSPDRLLSRLNQIPGLNAQKYNYTSQSEVESDHLPKGSVTAHLKRGLPSPTLKSVTSALAFALPGSAIVSGASDSPKSTSAALDKLSGSVAGQPAACPAAPPAEAGLPSSASHHIKTEQIPDHPLLPDRADFPGAHPVAPETSHKFSIPSVIVESASNLELAVTDPMTCESLTDYSQHASTSSGAETICQRDEPNTSDVGPVDAGGGYDPSQDLSVTPTLRNDDTNQSAPISTAHFVKAADQEEDSKSDSTVVNVPAGGKRVSLGKPFEYRAPQRLASDTDTTTNSEIELRNDPRRLTIRGRRVKEKEVGTTQQRNGVADLVQKFENPTSTQSKAELSNPGETEKDPLVGTSASQSIRSNAPLLIRPTKNAVSAIRPSFRRGKSEIIRSTSHVIRGKRPMVLADKNSGEDSIAGRSGRSSPQRTKDDKTTSSDLNPAVGSKVATRAHPRSGTRTSSSRTVLDTTSSHHKSAVTRSGVSSSETQPTTSRLAPASRGPRLSKDAGTRRARADSGVPVSSSLLNRRVNMAHHGKVGTIARHFDRISREADRMKHANEHRSRPRPIAHAKSSVQAFSSLTAAVNEDSDSDVDECGGNPAGDDADDEGDVPDGYGPETPAPIEIKDVESATANVAAPTDSEAPTLLRLPVSPVIERLSLDRFGHGSGSLTPGLMTTRTTPCSPSFLTESFKLPPSAVSQFSDNDMSSSDTGRHSIIKTLSSLWSYRGAEFLPLEYPQLPTEHQSAENPVLIREDEPSSIIAYTLVSKLYQDTLKETEPRVVERSEIFMPEEIKHRGTDIDSTWGMIEFTSEEIDHEDVLKVPTNSAKPMQFRFDVNPCTITCKVFFMHQFEALRKTLGCKEIVESLARCHKWDASGGKSGQKFLKTKDGRYLIKGISKTELEALTKFAPAYFEYLSSARKESRPITLAKMLGIFQVSFINKTTNRKGRLQVQVIENLWVTRPYLQIYDLKGLTRNRTVNVTGRPHEVLLDGNFCEMTRTNPILVHENSLLRLQASLHNDTLFLANNNVMDYSLAVGFDEENQSLFVGIIDYLQTYSWDKRLETLVKELGGTSKEAPTIITPSLYKARFRRAMGRYFLVAPDAWLHKWKPYLSVSDEDGIGIGSEKEGLRTDIGAKTEDSYIRFSCQ